LVIERLGPRLADVARRADEVAGMLDGLAQYFPMEEDRAMAVRLHLFQCFNHAALAACFGSAEGGILEQFARGHGSAFVETPAGNWRFVDGLPALLDRYAQALADPSRAALREKVTRLWADRAQELQTEHKAAAEAFARLEKDRDELFKELETARSQTLQRVDENQREWRSRIDEDVVRVGASLLANGAGVACFWGALFSDNQRMTFIVLGGILIGIGIGTPALKRSRKPSRVDHAALAHRKQEERVAQARGVVNLLEARTSGLQQRLAEDRRKVEALRAAIEEPYV
jgi:hypothetical protein